MEFYPEDFGIEEDSLSYEQFLLEQNEYQEQLYA